MTNPLFKHYLYWCESQNSSSISRQTFLPTLDSIQSAPHQRITRYSILLSPLQKVIDHNLKDRVSLIQNEVDALCRWLNNRVKLSEIDKELISISYSHLKVDSEEGKSELSHYLKMENSFNIFDPIPLSKVKDEKR